MRIRAAFLLCLAIVATGCFFHRKHPAAKPPTDAPSTKVAQPPAMAPVFLVDDFSDSAASAQRWSLETAGSASIVLSNHLVVLDMPGGTRPGSQAHLVLKYGFRLNRRGETQRVTWDMQILEDRPRANYAGLAIGQPDGARMIVAQSSLKEPLRGAAPTKPHDLRMTGAADDNVDHGTRMLHYDLTLTVNASGEVKANVTVFEHRAEFDTTPDAYPAAVQPLATMHSTISLNSGVDQQLYFWVERDDLLGDPFANAPRARIGVANVYASFGAR